jgi:hypothetical protein
VPLPSPVRGRRCPEGTDEGRFSVETSPCNSLARWRERARERVGAFHLTPTGGGRSQSSRHLGRQSRWCEAGSGGRFFSFNLCPLCGRHSAPLFSPRSRPMNGTVSRTRPGSSDLANATVTAREPTATEKPSAFLRSSKTAPATGRRDPAISGRRKKRDFGSIAGRGRMGTAPLSVDKDDCSPGHPRRRTRRLLNADD